MPPLPELDGFSYEPLMAVDGVPGSFDIDVNVEGGDDVFISPWYGGVTPRFFGPGLGWGGGPLFSPYFPRYSPFSYSLGPSWYYFNRPWYGFGGGWGWGGSGWGWGGLWRGPGPWVGPSTWNGPYYYWRGPWWGGRRAF